MKYSELLSEGFERKGLSLRDVVEELQQKFKMKIDYSYLSKLKSGNKSPASDKVNEVLANVLDINPMVLKAAAYREKIPQDVLEHINNTA
jgi:hypothetical protein